MNPPSRRFGIRDSLGREFHFDRPEDLRRAAGQRFLADAYQADRRAICLCRPEQPRLWILRHEVKRDYWPKRNSIDDLHDPGCPNLKIYRCEPGSREKIIQYAPRILKRPIPPASREVNPLASTTKSVESEPFGTYGSFANTAFSRSLITTFRAAYSGKGPESFAEEFLGAFEKVLSELHFQDSRNAFQVAESQRLALSFGITAVKLVTGLTQRPYTEKTHLWFRFPKGTRSSVKGISQVWLDRGIAEGFCGKTIAGTKNLPPPYFFFAVHGTEPPVAGVTRLFIQPLADIPSLVCPVESSLEAEVARWFVRHRCRFLKPKHPREFVLFPKLVAVRLDQERYIPDFVFEIDGVLWLVECAGFDSPDYELELERKLRYYGSLPGIRVLLIRRDQAVQNRPAFVQLNVGSQTIPLAPLHDWTPERVAQYGAWCTLPAPVSTGSRQGGAS